MGFAGRAAVAVALVLGASAVTPQPLRADQPTRISGVVVDAQGRPLAGAWISLRPGATSELHTNTDKHGYFNFVSLYSGPAEIKIAGDMYRQCTATLSLTSGSNVAATIRLVEQYPREIGRVVLYAPLPCRMVLIAADPYDRYVIQ